MSSSSEMNSAEEDPERYAAARDELMHLIRDGMAIDVMETYALHKQSCEYVYGIVRDVAYSEGVETIGEGARNFACNLLDDWSK
jgi:hypothetical protein